VFVVVSSSNPEGRELQLARVGSATVEKALYQAIGELNAAASEPYLGAVLGATRPFEKEPVLKMSGPLLIPGLGAQGATPEDVGERFRGLTNTLVVAVSRAWTDAGPSSQDLSARAHELQRALQSALS
jgi:orotidine-5'-phosphate decarboxylase